MHAQLCCQAQGQGGILVAPHAYGRQALWAGGLSGRRFAFAVLVTVLDREISTSQCLMCDASSTVAAAPLLSVQQLRTLQLVCSVRCTRRHPGCLRSGWPASNFVAKCRRCFCHTFYNPVQINTVHHVPLLPHTSSTCVMCVWMWSLAALPWKLWRSTMMAHSIIL